MKLISDLLKRSALASSQVTSIQVTAAWPKIAKVVCPDIAEETKAHKYVKKTLTVIVITSQHMMNMQLKEIQLLAECEEQLGKGVIEKIKFRIGRL